MQQNITLLHVNHPTLKGLAIQNAHSSIPLSQQQYHPVNQIQPVKANSYELSNQNQVSQSNRTLNSIQTPQIQTQTIPSPMQPIQQNIHQTILQTTQSTIPSAPQSNSIQNIQPISSSNISMNITSNLPSSISSSTPSTTSSTISSTTSSTISSRQSSQQPIQPIQPIQSTIQPIGHPQFTNPSQQISQNNHGNQPPIDQFQEILNLYDLQDEHSIKSLENLTQYYLDLFHKENRANPNLNESHTPHTLYAQQDLGTRYTDHHGTQESLSVKYNGNDLNSYSQQNFENGPNGPNVQNSMDINHQLTYSTDSQQILSNAPSYSTTTNPNYPNSTTLNNSVVKGVRQVKRVGTNQEPKILPQKRKLDKLEPIPIGKREKK